MGSFCSPQLLVFPAPSALGVPAMLREGHYLPESSQQPAQVGPIRGFERLSKLHDPSPMEAKW